MIVCLVALVTFMTFGFTVPVIFLEYEHFGTLHEIWCVLRKKTQPQLKSLLGFLFSLEHACNVYTNNNMCMLSSYKGESRNFKRCMASSTHTVLKTKKVTTCCCDIFAGSRLPRSSHGIFSPSPTFQTHLT